MLKIDNITGPAANFYHVEKQNVSENKEKREKQENESTEIIREVETECTLEVLKQLYDEGGIQRIAILGAARVFVDGTQKDSWQYKYNDNIQARLGEFMDTMEGPYTFLNGGWGGFSLVKEVLECH